MKTAVQYIQEAQKSARQSAERICAEFSLLRMDGGPSYEVMRGLECEAYKIALFDMQVSAAAEICALKAERDALRAQLGEPDTLWDTERMLDRRARALDMQKELRS
jgi:hypothetical protein